jgi:hypothetical protein
MLLLWKGALEGWNEKDRMREERRQENGGTGQAENGFPCWLREMDFLNIPARRNRQQFAVRAHSWLLVTSVSPNCCLYTEY